jgi:hypothetical protein
MKALSASNLTILRKICRRATSVSSESELSEARLKLIKLKILRMKNRQSQPLSILTHLVPEVKAKMGPEREPTPMKLT